MATDDYNSIVDGLQFLLFRNREISKVVYTRRARTNCVHVFTVKLNLVHQMGEFVFTTLFLKL